LKNKPELFRSFNPCLRDAPFHISETVNNKKVTCELFKGDFIEHEKAYSELNKLRLEPKKKEVIEAILNYCLIFGEKTPRVEELAEKSYSELESIQKKYKGKLKPGPARF